MRCELITFQNHAASPKLVSRLSSSDLQIPKASDKQSITCTGRIHVEFREPLQRTYAKSCNGYVGSYKFSETFEIFTSAVAKDLVDLRFTLFYHCAVSETRQ